jgi:hypothetical protein
LYAAGAKRRLGHTTRLTEGPLQDPAPVGFSTELGARLTDAPLHKALALTEAALMWRPRGGATSGVRTRESRGNSAPDLLA